MNSSESGRKLNQAVNTTSKAVGGALSQAKGAFSNFWSAFTAPAPISTTPTTNRTPEEISDETVPDEVIGNKTDETKTESLNGDRKPTHDQLKNDINDTENDNPDRIVEISKEADAIDLNGKNVFGQIFDI